MSCLDLMILLRFCLLYISIISFWYTTYWSVKFGLSKELVYIGIYAGTGSCSGTWITSSLSDVLHESNTLPPPGSCRMWLRFSPVSLGVAGKVCIFLDAGGLQLLLLGVIENCLVYTQWHNIDVCTCIHSHS